MHLEYSPADMIMIDFAGKKQSCVEADTGEQIICQVFVSILPFSGYIFCEAVEYLLCPLNPIFFHSDSKYRVFLVAFIL